MHNLHKEDNTTRRMNRPMNTSFTTVQISLNNAAVSQQRTRSQRGFVIATVASVICAQIVAAIPISSSINSRELPNRFLRSQKIQQHMSLSSSELQSYSSKSSSSVPSCYYCHLLFPEVLTKDHEGQQNEFETRLRANTTTQQNLVIKSNSSDEVHCLRRITGSKSMIKHPIAIELPAEFVSARSSLIENGEAHVCIHGAYESEDEDLEQSSDIQRIRKRVLQIPRGSGSIEILNHNHPVRVLQETNENTQVRANTTSYFFGTKRLLVVRVVTAGYVEQPAETIDEIQGAIFGTGRNPNSIPSDGTVVAQYNAISQGNLFFTPAYVEGGVTNELQSSGVIEVELPTYIKTFINASVRDYLVPEILLATESKLGRPLDQVADYIIFCIPNNSLLRDDSQWTAFTYLYEPYSYFQESRCTKLSVVMHEMGHGLGFKHSGNGIDEYADKTGYMGYAVNYQAMPRKAFNGHKHWMSQWFSDRAIDIPLWMIGQQGVKLRVAAFIDYDKLQQQTLMSSSPPIFYQIVVRINSELYLQYNFADSYNLHTDVEHANRLTLVESKSNSHVSDLKGSLGWGEQYVYQVETSSRAFIIKVCSTGEDDIGANVGTVRYASVSIYYIDDDNAASVAAIASQEDYCTMDDTSASALTNTSAIGTPTSKPSSLGNLDQPSTPIKPYLPEVLGDDPTSVTAKPNNEGIFEDIHSESNDKVETKVLIPILISSILLVAILIGLVVVLIARQKRKLEVTSEMNEATNNTNPTKKSTSQKISASSIRQNIKQAISKDSGLLNTTIDISKKRLKTIKPIPEFTESSTRDESSSEHDEPAADNIVVLSNIDKQGLEEYKRRYSKSKERKKRHTGRKKSSSSSLERSCRIIPRPGEIETVIATAPFPSSIEKASRYNQHQQYHDHTNATRETRVPHYNHTGRDYLEKDTIQQQLSSPNDNLNAHEDENNPKRMHRSRIDKRSIENERTATNELFDESGIVVSSKLKRQGKDDKRSSRHQESRRDRVDDPDCKPNSKSIRRHDESILNPNRVQI